MRARTTASRKRSAVARGAALLALVAGGAAAVASRLTWMSANDPIVFTRGVSVQVARGTDVPLGIATAAAAAVLLIVALSWLTWARGRRGPAVLVLLFGAAIFGFAVYSVMTLEARFADFAAASAAPRLSATGVRDVVATILSNGATEVHGGVGPIIAGLAGGCASLAAIAFFASARTTVSSAPIGGLHGDDLPSFVEMEIPSRRSSTALVGQRRDRDADEAPEPAIEESSFDGSGAWAFTTDATPRPIGS